MCVLIHMHVHECKEVMLGDFFITLLCQGRASCTIQSSYSDPTFPGGQISASGAPPDLEIVIRNPCLSDFYVGAGD